jgi:hypothetical protein
LNESVRRRSRKAPKHKLLEEPSGEHVLLVDHRGSVVESSRLMVYDEWYIADYLSNCTIVSRY